MRGTFLLFTPSYSLLSVKKALSSRAKSSRSEGEARDLGMGVLRLSSVQSHHRRSLDRVFAEQCVGSSAQAEGTAHRSVRLLSRMKVLFVNPAETSAARWVRD